MIVGAGGAGDAAITVSETTRASVFGGVASGAALVAAVLRQIEDKKRADEEVERQGTSVRTHFAAHWQGSLFELLDP
jgi:hypothetical protein